MVASPDAIRALVEPALAAEGLELWDVEIARDEVRVLVDRPGGIDLDELARVAGRVVSPLIDDHPGIVPDGPYQLQVSSPGIERTLRRADQYARYVGTEISVKTSVAIAGARRHHGVLLSVDERAIALAPKDAPAGTTVELPLADIERARTVLVWGPAEGGNKKAKAPKAPARQAVKRPAASGREAGQPVASNDSKDSGS